MSTWEISSCKSCPTSESRSAPHFLTLVLVPDVAPPPLPCRPDDERHKKKRKGSVDSGSDGPGKVKNQMQRKQTNLSHLLVQKTVETLSKGQDAEMQDVSSSSTTVSATITTTTTLAGGQPGLPINGHDTKPGPSTSAALAPAPPTTVIPVIGTNSQPTQVRLSSSSSGLCDLLTSSPSALARLPFRTRSWSRSKPSKSSSKRVSAPYRVQPPFVVRSTELGPGLTDDWSNKKVFPAHLRPEIHTLVEAAIACDWYGPEFFNL